MADLGILGSTTAVLAERSMELSNRSEQFIANNIANFETPGFKARQLSFASQLHAAIAEGPAALSQVQGTVVTDTGSVRTDGSSVDLSSQMIDLAQVQLYYGLAQQALSAKATTLATITQGKVV